MDKTAVIGQLDRAIRRVGEALSRVRQGGEYGDVFAIAKTLGVETVRRMSPRDSGYLSAAKAALKSGFEDLALESLVGVLKALREDYSDDCLDSVESLLRAEVAGDYLEQADELLSNGYKDAAAVMIGAVLEQHLKSLATKNGIEIEKPDGSAKKADGLNAELASATAAVYDKTEQKNVTYLLGLRNDAAHGHYTKYDKAKIEVMLASVRLFVRTYPT
ncbi:MAG: hypothetical protein KF760_17835 [Candidatus Eremiobacteraeota bacterium]|nr:hypothetical protein [Candidatus Eremiobacteraeota bacterium]MCW5869242.1 hypothetical protein [Candidatus Eremiobacteraeota bacterium]